LGRGGRGGPRILTEKDNVGKTWGSGGGLGGNFSKAGGGEEDCHSLGCIIRGDKEERGKRTSRTLEGGGVENKSSGGNEGWVFKDGNRGKSGSPGGPSKIDVF